MTIVVENLTMRYIALTKNEDQYDIKSRSIVANILFYSDESSNMI